MKIYFNVSNPERIYENFRKSMKFMKIHENLWKPMKIDENKWQSKRIHKEIMNIYGIDMFCKKRKGYILYPRKTKSLTYLSSRRGIHYLNREHENQWFCANLYLYLQNACQSHVLMKTWNDPTVIADMLPQTVSPKP